MLIDEARVTLVLENVMRHTIKMALKESQVKVDYWTDFEDKKVEGRLNLTVSCACDADLALDCESMLEQADETTLEYGSSLGLLLSKQVCKRLKGDLTVNSFKEDDKLTIRFYMTFKCLKVPQFPKKRKIQGEEEQKSFDLHHLYNPTG